MNHDFVNHVLLASIRAAGEPADHNDVGEAVGDVAAARRGDDGSGVHDGPVAFVIHKETVASHDNYLDRTSET